MRKYLNVFLVMLLLFTAGCGGILLKPDIYSVKKVAIISIYMNRAFYNMKAPLAHTGINFLKALVKTKDKEEKEKQQVITYALKAYSVQLNSIDEWAVLSPIELIKNREYQNFLKMEGNDFLTKVADKIRQAEEDKWVVPDKMRFIPIANVAKDEELKQNLAELAKKLGVDAVVMIQVDIAYKKGMSFASATPLLKSGQKLKPMISSAMVAVSKEGKAVVKTALIEPGGGTRYKGEKVWATVKNGRILLAHETGKVVSGFNAGIEIAAAGLKEELAKALSKK